MEITESDTAVFKEALSGVMLCYELAEPITITVDSHTITTLLGTNNIWSDAGEVLVTYRADIQLYIDNTISAATEEESNEG